MIPTQRAVSILLRRPQLLRKPNLTNACGCTAYPSCSSSSSKSRLSRHSLRHARAETYSQALAAAPYLSLPPNGQTQGTRHLQQSYARGRSATNVAHKPGGPGGCRALGRSQHPAPGQLRAGIPAGARRHARPGPCSPRAWQMASPSSTLCQQYAARQQLAHSSEKGWLKRLCSLLQPLPLYSSMFWISKGSSSTALAAWCQSMRYSSSGCACMRGGAGARGRGG
jgi:hypothetical protein